MVQHYITNASILLLCVFGHYLMSLRLHQKRELPRTGYYRLWTGGIFGLAGVFLVSSAVLLLDIDYFKAYNDNNGHVAGDQCLKRIAAVVDHYAVREEAVACRYGGEEFAIVLPDASVGKALACALEIGRTVQELAIPHGGSSAYGCVTLSAGAAAAIPGEEGIEREELLVFADKALYMAKRSGRNRVMAWSQQERESAVRMSGEPL